MALGQRAELLGLMFIGQRKAQIIQIAFEHRC
jgi:hypothetical protein